MSACSTALPSIANRTDSNKDVCLRGRVSEADSIGAPDSDRSKTGGVGPISATRTTVGQNGRTSEFCARPWSFGMWADGKGFAKDFGNDGNF
ncbi:Flagellar hook protein FlgE [Anopheles sinensis]|uniref:Flagellar hook protein FlgE n=1 Tax=Anopheles sinensis TaxID=74873 RepID=A0A084WTP8_ANOSI|nr:Flagellar hook protein FlgE [Anopheles sinensis]